MSTSSSRFVVYVATFLLSLAVLILGLIYGNKIIYLLGGIVFGFVAGNLIAARITYTNPKSTPKMLEFVFLTSGLIIGYVGIRASESHNYYFFLLTPIIIGSAFALVWQGLRPVIVSSKE